MTEPLNVLLTLKFDDDTLDRLRAVSPNIKIRMHPAEKERDVPNKAWQNVDVLYTTTILPPAAQPTRMQWIHSHYAGVDSLLKSSFIKANPDITITSSSGIHVSKIGEYVIGMMLALGHHLPTMLQHQAKHTWAENRYSIFMARELGQSVVGILGYGRLGREISRLCKSFGATVLATKRDVMHPEDKRYILPGKGDAECDLCDRLYPPEATAFMVKECDFVVVTLPLTDDTRNSIGKSILEAMKPTAYLINVGRGGIVDEQELLEALKSKRIAGAAFDVFAEEPLPPDHPLWDAPNMIISPHISGNMWDYRQKAAAVFEENLRRFLEKRPLINVVNRELGY